MLGYKIAAFGVLLSLLLPMNLLAAGPGQTPVADQLQVPKVMGPGAFRIGVDAGGAIVPDGPFCDQVDIICDARCQKLSGVWSCYGGGTGFCSFSLCTGGF